MLKARRDGYDGRGNVVVRTADAAEAACAHLGWPERAAVRRGLRRVRARAGLLVVRGLDGTIVQYPVVETVQDPHLHICREVLAPADVSPRRCRAGADDRPRRRRGRRRRGRLRRRAVPAARRPGRASTSSRRGRTTRPTTPSRRAGRRSSTTTCARCWACRSATRRCVPPAAVMVNLLGSQHRPHRVPNLPRWPSRTRSCTCTAKPTIGRAAKWATSRRVGDTLEEARDRGLAARQPRARMTQTA